MTLDELETLCKATRYFPDPLRFRDERESEGLQLVLKLIAVVRAAKYLHASMHVPSERNEVSEIYSLRSGAVRALDFALSALESSDG